MKELLTHVARILYSMDTVSASDKHKILELVSELKEKSSKFVPPTVLEVATYLTEQGFKYPQKYADSFVSFYGSKGWMVGKNKMKNWKLATKQWKEWEKKSNIYV